MTSRHAVGLLRAGTLVAAVVVPFWPSLLLVVRQSVAGMPLAYLAAVPGWCLVIAWGRRARLARGVDIHDRQLDWTVAGSVGLIASLALSGLQRRLGDLGLVWRVDLLAWIAWAIICSVVIYGVRAVTLCWPVWLFALACWPAPYLLALTRHGRSMHAQTHLEIALAVLAALLAADGWRRRSAAAALTAAGVGAFALHWPEHPLWVLVLAAGVPSLAVPTVGRWVRGPAVTRGKPSRAGGGPGLRRTVVRTCALATAAVAVSVTVTPPASAQGTRFGPEVQMPVLGHGWTPINPGPGRIPVRYLGPRTEVARFRFANSDRAEVMVDVLEHAPCAGIGPDGTVNFYQGAAALTGRLVRLRGGTGRERFSDPNNELTPGQAGWVALFWVHRQPARPVECEQMAFFSPASAAPEIVPPTVRTVLIRPLGALIRQNGPATASTDADGIAQVMSAAQAVLDGWAGQ